MGKLSKLDTDKQEVIVEMYRDDGKSLKEIATEYDCTPPTVATFLRSKGVIVRGKGKRKKVAAVNSAEVDATDGVADIGYMEVIEEEMIEANGEV